MPNNLNLIKDDGETRIYEKKNSFKVRLELEDTTIRAYDFETNKEIGYISLECQDCSKPPYFNDFRYLLYYISDFEKKYRRNGLGETIIRMFLDLGIEPIYARNPCAQRSEFNEEDCSYLVKDGPAFVMRLSEKGLLTYEGQFDSYQNDNDFNCM